MIEPFSLPLSSPLSTADGTIERRAGFVVRSAHRGETGLGEATPLPGWTESLAECREALEGVAEASPDDQGVRLHELDGTPAARHGLATALIDADARAESVPLYRWLGEGRHCERVPVNATVGDGPTEETVAAAERAVEAGFDCLKIKVGARSLEVDLDRIRTVRDAVGDDPRLRLDANGAWNRDQADRALDALAPLDVAYVEQPLPPEDLDGHAALSGGPVDVAVDETLRERSIGAVLERNMADVVVLKPMVLGGPGTTHTLAVRAREAGVDPVVTTTVDAVVARTAAVHVAAAVPDIRPCGLATADRLSTDLAPDPAPVSGGTVSVPQDPGLGIDPVEVSL